MGLYLGLDTSNYTTSAALYDSCRHTVTQNRRLLPVRQGERGIRQNEAVFHHTAALPDIIAPLFSAFSASPGLCAVGVSDRPTEREGSYMPCFTVGVSAAACLGEVDRIPVYRNTHRQGHIFAALFGANRLDLAAQPFLAFHLSGGTTEAVLCTPSETEMLSCRLLAASSDLKAGQAIDRVGVMLGLPFPAGPALDRLSLSSTKKFHPKPSMRDGCPSLSGIQNRCEKMLTDGAAPADIANFCIESVCAAVLAMTEAVQGQYPGLPVVFSGGVTANSRMRTLLTERCGGIFAPPAYSSDNAVGCAVLAALKDGAVSMNG